MTCREDGCKRRARPGSPYCADCYAAILTRAFGRTVRADDIPARVFLSDLTSPLETPRGGAVVAREDPPSPSTSGVTSGVTSGRLGRHGHVGDNRGAR